MVIYICIKFQVNNSLQVTKGHNSKSRLRRVTILVFCTSSDDGLHLFEVLLKYLERFPIYRADMSTW